MKHSIRSIKKNSIVFNLKIVVAFYLSLRNSWILCSATIFSSHLMLQIIPRPAFIKVHWKDYQFRSLFTTLITTNCFYNRVFELFASPYATMISHDLCLSFTCVHSLECLKWRPQFFFLESSTIPTYVKECRQCEIFITSATRKL